MKDKGERRKKPRFLNLAFYFSALVIMVHESFFRIESKSSKHNDTIHEVQEKNKKRERELCKAIKPLSPAQIKQLKANCEHNIQPRKQYEASVARDGPRGSRFRTYRRETTLEL